MLANYVSLGVVPSTPTTTSFLIVAAAVTMMARSRGAQTGSTQSRQIQRLLPFIWAPCKVSYTGTISGIQGKHRNDGIPEIGANVQLSLRNAGSCVPGTSQLATSNLIRLGEFFSRHVSVRLNPTSYPMVETMNTARELGADKQYIGNIMQREAGEGRDSMDVGG